MKIPEIKVTLVCLFCKAPLEGPEDAEYSSGDLIKCTQCGEQNDYDSVLEVAAKKGMKQLEEAMEEQMEEQLAREFEQLSSRRR